jgi:surfeit locus 1 family protein
MKMQFKFNQYRFNASWLSTLLVLVCVVVFIKLGLWQYHKAALKQHIEQAYQASLAKDVVNLAEHLSAPEVLEYQKVKVTGHYETQYQLLIDNQVEDNQAGFHVITPFKIRGTERYVMVNRGWVKGYDQHSVTPTFTTPEGDHEITGMLWIPSSKIFSLESKVANANNGFEHVWQHLDMGKFQKIAPIQALSIIVKLDPEQKEGGFVRRWQLPPSRIATNLGYAYQWFGFAVAAIAIYLYLGVTHVKKED